MTSSEINALLKDTKASFSKIDQSKLDPNLYAWLNSAMLLLDELSVKVRIHTHELEYNMWSKRPVGTLPIETVKDE